MKAKISLAFGACQTTYQLGLTLHRMKGKVEEHRVHFTHSDTDNDGKVSWDEHIKGMLLGGDGKLSEVDIRKAFDSKDHNKVCIFSPPNNCAALLVYSAMLSPRPCAQDGHLTLKEHDEHIMGWIKELARGALAKGDKNGDGMLDKDEFMNIHTIL